MKNSSFLTNFKTLAFAGNVDLKS